MGASGDIVRLSTIALYECQPRCNGHFIKKLIHIRKLPMTLGNGLKISRHLHEGIVDIAHFVCLQLSMAARNMCLLACVALATLVQSAAAFPLQWASEVPYVASLGGLAETQGWRLVGSAVYVANNRTITKLDALTGATQWTREVGASPTFRVMQDGGIVTLSFATGSSQGSATATSILTRLDPSGAVLWSNPIATPTGSFSSLVRADTAANAVAIEFGSSDGMAAMFDETGVQLWRRAGRAGCVIGGTGAMLCASSASTKLFARADGALVAERTYAGVESGYLPQVLANTDGSFTVGRDTVGFNAQRWLASGVVAATFALPTARSKWVFRSNGGAFAYQFDNTQSGGNAVTAYVSSFSPSGAIEWQLSYPETSYYNQALASGDALYLGRYWGGLTRVDKFGVSKFENFPVALSEAALVGNDFLWAAGGPLVLQRVDSTLVWSKQQFELSDNAGSYSCDPQLFFNEQSIGATRLVAQNTPAVLDLFDRNTGTMSAVVTPPSVDINLRDSYGLGAQHCRTAVDVGRNVFQVIATRAADGVLSWVVRVTNPAGNVVRVSAPVTLSAQDTQIVRRDVQVLPDGSYYVQVNDTLSQFNGAGQTLWTSTLPGVGFGYGGARLLQDTSGGVFVTSGNFLRRYSSTGELLWDITISSYVRVWQLAPDGGLFVVFSGSGADTLEKLSPTGQSVWANTLVLSGGVQTWPEFTQIGSLPAGGAFVAGCYTVNFTRKLAMVLGFSASGNRQFFTTLPGTSPAFDTCVSSVTSLSDESIMVAVNQTYWASSRQEPLPAWNTGTFRLKPTGEVANTWLDLDRTALRTLGGWSLMVTEPGDFVVQAGRFSQHNSYFMTAAARKWKVPLQARSVTAAIAGAQYQFGEIPPFRFTLRDGSGVEQVANEATLVWLQPTDATPADGPNAVIACSIAIGASYCDNAAVRTQMIGQGRKFEIMSDGNAPSQTPPINVVPASVNLTARILDAPPYFALSTVSVEFTITPTQLPVGQSFTVPNFQYWNVPSLTLGSTPNTCQRISAIGTFPVVQVCTVMISPSSSSIAASANASPLTLASGNVVVNIGPLSLGNAVIYLERLWPSNPAPLSRPLEPIVSLRINEKKLGGQVPAGALIFNLGGQTCVASAILVDTPLGTYETGNYSCAITPASTGNLAFGVQFSGSTSLNSASAPNLGSVNVQGVTGFVANHASAVSQNVPVRVCSPTSGLNCEVSPFGDQSFCAAALGWQGQLRLQAINDAEFRLAEPPPTVSITAQPGFALVQMPTLTATPASSGACFLDIDRDGYISAERDGLALLRGLLGFSGDALTTGLVDACSSRTDAASIALLIAQQSAVGAYDVDLDGNARSMTDALLVIRYLLGLRNDALVAGVTFPPSAQRNSAAAVTGYLQWGCGL